MLQTRKSHTSCVKQGCPPSLLCLGSSRGLRTTCQSCMWVAMWFLMYYCCLNPSCGLRITCQSCMWVAMWFSMHYCCLNPSRGLRTTCQSCMCVVPQSVVIGTFAVKKSCAARIFDLIPVLSSPHASVLNLWLQWLQWLQWGVTFSQVVWLIGCWLVSASHKWIHKLRKKKNLWLHNLWLHNLWPHNLWPHILWLHILWLHNLWLHTPLLPERWAHSCNFFWPCIARMQCLQEAACLFNLFLSSHPLMRMQCLQEAARLFDLFLSSHPLMPLYLGAVSMCAVREELLECEVGGLRVRFMLHNAAAMDKIAAWVFVRKWCITKVGQNHIYTV